MKRLLLTLTAIFCISTSVWAGMDGQPQPSTDTLARLRNAVRQFFVEGGDLGKARPDLILLVERDPTADIVDWLSPVLKDEIAYTGLATTFGEAMDAAEPGSPKQHYLRYNLARLHLHRSFLYTVSGHRKPYLDAAEKLAEQFPSSVRDAAVWELKGDIAFEKGSVEGAIAAYSRMSSAGAGPAWTQYKMATAYQKARRWSDAKAQYERASRTELATGTPGQLYHQIQQGLASLHLEQRELPQAASALLRSLKIAESEKSKVRLRSDVARLLLARGQRPAVIEYAEAALKITPDDPALKGLLEQAGGSN
jgi:tetratricopeptide (TPR) repeat protein